VGRTEFDSPDVDNEVLIDSSKCKDGRLCYDKIIMRLNLIYESLLNLTASIN
jgi:hypothetical protein